MSRLVFSSTLSLALALAPLAGHAAGKSPSGPLPSGTTKVQHNKKSNSMKPVTAVINWYDNETGVDLPFGFDNVDDPTSITCNNVAGCVIQIVASAQVRSDTDGNLWAICSLVDGQYANPGCGYQGQLETGIYQMGNAQMNYQVAQGKHTVQTQVYVNQEALLGRWQVTYSLFNL